MEPGLWKYRTTLVRIAGRWELLELHENVNNLNEMDGVIPGLLYESLIVTVMQRDQRSLENTGIFLEEPPVSKPQEELPSAPLSGTGNPSLVEADEGMPDDTNLSDEERPQEFVSRVETCVPPFGHWGKWFERGTLQAAGQSYEKKTG